MFPSILSAWLFTVYSMRRNQFHSAFFSKLLIKLIAVISFIADKPIGCILRKTTVYSRFNKFYLMGRSAFNVSGDRKTCSVCNCHDLGAFAALCLADSKPPFFASPKVPSIKASLVSIPPHSYRSCTSSWEMSRKVPCLKEPPVACLV
jgi:hypothetical protein